jgi:hypothetical protein
MANAEESTKKDSGTHLNYVDVSASVQEKDGSPLREQRGNTGGHSIKMA